MERIRKKHANKAPLCDLCGYESASERHHIINKGLTMGNAEARAEANVAAITCLLCHDCHTIADSEESREKILQKLYKINGRGLPVVGYLVCMTAYIKVQYAMNTLLPWTLPEPSQQ
jgi:hypothetical protein